MSHDEERVNRAAIWEKGDRAPRHWLNPLVRPRDSTPTVATRKLPRPVARLEPNNVRGEKSAGGWCGSPEGQNPPGDPIGITTRFFS